MEPRLDRHRAASGLTAEPCNVARRSTAGWWKKQHKGQSVVADNNLRMSTGGFRFPAGFQCNGRHYRKACQLTTSTEHAPAIAIPRETRWRVRWSYK